MKWIILSLELDRQSGNVLLCRSKTSKKQFALKSLFNVSDWREAARMNLQASGNDCIFHIEGYTRTTGTNHHTCTCIINAMVC